MTLLKLEENRTHAALAKSRNPAPYSASVAPDDSLAPYPTASGKKVSIIGCGQVGLAAAYALINQEIPSSIALVDMNASKLEGEAKDLSQGSAFHDRVRIEASSDYDITSNSHLVIITAGSGRRPGESRLDLMERNINIMKAIVPKVLEKSPGTAICVVSNPCDVMTAVAAKVAGPNVPPGRIFGSGTVLETSRLRTLLARSLDISTRSVHGYIIGEHGDSNVAAFSSVRVGGVPLLQPGENPSAEHEAIHREVVESAAEVIKLKGYTNWAIGLALAQITNAVLNDHRVILPVSSCVRGYAGVEEDVFLSLPCVVDATGVRQLIELPLTDLEKEKFKNSAQKVWDVQSQIWNFV